MKRCSKTLHRFVENNITVLLRTPICGAVFCLNGRLLVLTKEHKYGKIVYDLQWVCYKYTKGDFTMKQLFKNAKIFGYGKSDLLVSDSVIAEIGKDIQAEADVVFDLENKYIFPGFVDVHVHLREPGFVYKEKIKTGTLAAARGGFTHVCSMPNLKPVPDCMETLTPQLDAIAKDAVIAVHPYGSITVEQKGERLSAMEEMAEKVIAFSDDGRGVQDEALMKSAMEKARGLGKMIVAHCEDNTLLKGGYIHDGKYAAFHGHKGICSESEWGPIARDLKLAEQVGVGYHVCHISTKESVEIVRQAKARGVNVTCETAPHYLILSDKDLKEEGRFKMNPPLRDEEDRLALVQGIKDGTIDMIATDHAPHSAQEKSKGLEGSSFGVVGIETSFAEMYTAFVKKGEITLERLMELMSFNPGKRFGIDVGIAVGKTADFTVFDLSEEYTVDSQEFVSIGRSTPFEGDKVYGKCIMTMAGGKIAWQK